MNTVQVNKNTTCLSYALQRTGREIPQLTDIGDIDEFFTRHEIDDTTNLRALPIGTLLLFTAKERIDLVPRLITQDDRIVTQPTMILRHIGVLERDCLISDCGISAKNYPFCKHVRLRTYNEMSAEDRPTFYLKEKGKVWEIEDHIGETSSTSTYAEYEKKKEAADIEAFGRPVQSVEDLTDEDLNDMLAVPDGLYEQLKNLGAKREKRRKNYTHDAAVINGNDIDRIEVAKVNTGTGWPSLKIKDEFSSKANDIEDQMSKGESKSLGTNFYPTGTFEGFQEAFKSRIAGIMSDEEQPEVLGDACADLHDEQSIPMAGGYQGYLPDGIVKDGVGIETLANVFAKLDNTNQEQLLDYLNVFRNSHFYEGRSLFTELVFQYAFTRAEKYMWVDAMAFAEKYLQSVGAKVPELSWASPSTAETITAILAEVTKIDNMTQAELKDYVDAAITYSLNKPITLVLLRYAEQVARYMHWPAVYQPLKDYLKN